VKPENPVLKGHVENVWSTLSGDFERGYLLEWKSIEKITGISRHDKMFPRIQEKLRNRFLKELKIKVKAEHGIGYRLLDVRSQIDEGALGRSGRASRQLHKGGREVRATRHDGTFQERAVAGLASSALERSRKMVLRQKSATRNIMQASIHPSPVHKREVLEAQRKIDQAKEA